MFRVWILHLSQIYYIGLANFVNQKWGFIMGKNKIKDVAPKTKQCKYCKSSINKKAKVCPFCQRKQIGKGGLITMIVCLCIVGGMIAIVATVASNGNNSPSIISQSTDDWLEFDKKSWEQFVTLYKYHNNLTTVMEWYSDRKISASDFYTECKTARDKFRDISSKFNYGNTSEQKDYLGVLENWALSDQMAAQDLMDYADSLKPSKLSSANENLQRAKSAINTAASNRGKLLVKAGLSDSEIKSKVESDMASLE